MAMPSARALARAPYASADAHMRSLALQAEGFGENTVGGLEGPLVRVTSLADSGNGSLRAACEAVGPVWIVFDVSGSIALQKPIRVQSHKTVDGRGQHITLTGAGFHLRECCHVIICNLCFSGGRGHDADGIQLKPKSQHIWIDRCTLEDFDDGLIDITRASTDVTVSRCHFRRHDKTMLIGADPKHTEDRAVRVTVHHCFFDGTRQRHPRVRFGKVHLYNNYTRCWGIYAICASVEAQILSQLCVYESDRKKNKAFEYYSEKAADKDTEATGAIRSEGDVFLNGAKGEQRNPQNVFSPGTMYKHDWSLQECNVHAVVSQAGWQNIPLPLENS